MRTPARLLPSLLAAGLVALLGVPAVAADCHDDPLKCPSRLLSGGSASGGFSTEVGGAAITVVLAADAGTQSNGTPSVEPGGGGRLQVTFRKDSNESTQGNTQVRIVLQQVGNLTWTTTYDRNFTFDLDGAPRTETFRFEAPAGSPEGIRTFKVALVVGEEGVANPLAVVVDDRPDPTTISRSFSRDGPKDDEGIPAPGALVALAAMAVGLALAARRKA